jgi:hypothetical protein
MPKRRTIKKDTRPMATSEMTAERFSDRVPKELFDAPDLAALLNGVDDLFRALGIASAHARDNA